METKLLSPLRPGKRWTQPSEAEEAPAQVLGQYTKGLEGMGWGMCYSETPTHLADSLPQKWSAPGGL